MKKQALRISLLLFLLSLFYWFSLNYTYWISLDELKTQRRILESYYQERPWVFSLFYFAVYVGMTALSIPGATVLALAGGAIFGFWRGALLVSFASATGGTLSFLLARFMFRDWIQANQGEKLARINEGMETSGPYYLFALRLTPVFPFFLVNLLMGLTSMKVFSFFWITQLGMLPGTLLYVNAGTQLGQIETVKEIFDPPMIFSFVLMGLLPLSTWKMTHKKGVRRRFGWSKCALTDKSESGSRLPRDPARELDQSRSGTQ